MNYTDDILNILNEAGSDGLSIQKITRHVYNTHNTLFHEVSFEVVRGEVVRFLHRNSKDHGQLIEKVGLKPVYRLNMKSEKTQQLMLHFEDYAEENTEKPIEQDLSLSLF